MLLTCLILALGAGAWAAPDAALVRALAERILACRHEPTGVFLIAPIAEGTPAGLSPYFAHFAAYGLLRAYEVVPDPEYLAAADAWVDWYREHMQADGTVTDYRLEPDGRLTSAGDMDSTDSYAALYLWLIAERWRAKPEPAEWLRERELSCFRAYSAIMLTLQADGLTVAKPSYPIEYMMDNAEVIVGLWSGVSVFEALGNEGMATQCRRLGDRMEAELRTFYSPEHGYFAIYRDLQGRKGYQLTQWYPDVMAQVLALMRIGRAQEPDRSVFARVARDFLEKEFDLTRPLRHAWYGLAAQRVGDTDWADRIIGALGRLTPESVSNLDSVECNTVLEAITGGTRP